MAGSFRWYVYTSDAGNNYCIKLDKTNTNDINAGAQLWAVGSTQLEIPKNLKPRHAFYRSADGKRTIRVYPLTQTIYNGLEAGVPTITDPIAGAGNLTFAYKVPERIRPTPNTRDTGLSA